MLSFTFNKRFNWIWLFSFKIAAEANPEEIFVKVKEIFEALPPRE